MKLRELNAVFIAAPANGAGHRRLSAPDGAQGLLFQCPCCAVGAARAPDGGLVGVHWIRLWFANPIAAAPAPAELLPAPRWVRTGETLDALTLSPSVDLSVSGAGCGWHGFVREGAAA